MTNTNPPIDILSGPERRRRWAAAEKVAIVNETYEPGVTVSLVARRHGIAPNQLFHWRKLATQGALTAAGRGEEVVPASDYRALQNQVRELRRLGKRPWKPRSARRRWRVATGPKKQLLRSLPWPRGGSR
jgi:transposase